jgi:hypothetical protein
LVIVGLSLNAKTERGAKLIRISLNKKRNLRQNG